MLEIDGWAFPGGRQAFEDDRVRRNHPVFAGYTAMNLTWRQLESDPAWVLECVRRALRSRSVGFDLYWQV